MNILQISKLESAYDYAIIGGKARGLLMLRNAGYTIPDSQIIVIGEYASYLEAGSKLQKEDYFPIVNAVMQCIAACDTPSVILRSSCEIEDGHVTSFAGMFNSVLLDCSCNVDVALLTDNIETMLSAPLNRIYHEYSEKQDTKFYPDHFTIIVQPYQKSVLSGVMFTVDPINYNNSEVIIEFVLGSNEQVTSGTIVPAIARVNKKTSNITMFEPGVTDIALSRELKEFLVSLAGLGEKIERVANAPQDIEWLYCDDRFVFLQARPITSLK